MPRTVPLGGDRMNVLVACEESQAVCIAFRERGHRAFSCDVQECSGGHPEWHIQSDVIPLLNGDCTFQTADTHTHTQRGRWDLIIAFPPCTYISNAGACRLYPKAGQLDMERYAKGLKGKAFFMAFWWYGFFGCGRIAIENPVSSTVFEMPKHTQEIQPWQFGHPVTKKTRLWLFDLPTLEPTKIVEPTAPYLPAGTSRKDTSKYGRAFRTGKDATQRSKTFPGIAKAMAEQWGNPDAWEEQQTIDGF